MKFAPTHLLGVAVGGVILLTNSRTLLVSFDVTDSIRWVVYAAILLLTIGALYVAVQRNKRQAGAGQAAAENAEVTEAVNA